MTSLFPTAAEELSTAWLTKVLQASGAIGDTGVASYALRSLAGTGQTSETVKVELTYDHDAPRAPSDLVAKFASRNDTTRATFHALGMYEAEVRFYSDLSREAGIRVPHIHIRFRECGLSAFDVNGLHEESAAERGVDWRANAFDGLNQKLELNRVIDTL